MKNSVCGGKEGEGEGGGERGRERGRERERRKREEWTQNESAHIIAVCSTCTCASTGTILTLPCSYVSSAVVTQHKQVHHTERNSCLLSLHTLIDIL